MRVSRLHGGVALDRFTSQCVGSKRPIAARPTMFLTRRLGARLGGWRLWHAVRGALVDVGDTVAVLVEMSPPRTAGGRSGRAV